MRRLIAVMECSETDQAAGEFLFGEARLRPTWSRASTLPCRVVDAPLGSPAGWFAVPLTISRRFDLRAARFTSHTIPFIPAYERLYGWPPCQRGPLWSGRRSVSTPRLTLAYKKQSRP